MVLKTIVTGAYEPTYNWGAHIVGILVIIDNMCQDDSLKCYGDSKHRE